MPPAVWPLLGREPEEQFEVVAHVGELGGQVGRFVHRAGEDESALEDGEDVVGEGRKLDGGSGRMHAGGGFELVEQPLSPLADRADDHVAGAVAGELALVDEGDEQAARLGGGKLGGDLLEVPDERDELLRRIVGLGLGLRSAAAGAPDGAAQELVRGLGSLLCDLCRRLRRLAARLSIETVPLILVDAAGLACGLVTLGITLRMRGSLVRPSTWAACPEA